MSIAARLPSASSSVPPSETPKSSLPNPSASVWRTKSASPAITRTVVGLTRCAALDTRWPSS